MLLVKHLAPDQGFECADEPLDLRRRSPKLFGELFKGILCGLLDVTHRLGLTSAAQASGSRISFSATLTSSMNSSHFYTWTFHHVPKHEDWRYKLGISAMAQSLIHITRRTFA